MISFTVDDMTCGHCASAITKAVKAVDKDAKVEIDIAAHRVHIQPTEADADELAEAIREAGYTPVPTEAVPPKVAKPSGCCRR